MYQKITIDIRINDKILLTDISDTPMKRLNMFYLGIFGWQRALTLLALFSHFQFLFSLSVFLSFSRFFFCLLTLSGSTATLLQLPWYVAYGVYSILSIVF